MANQTKTAFNFRTDSPPLCVCGVCGQPFRDWAVADQEWAKLPVELQGLQLCEADFCKAYAEAGHDTRALQVSLAPWQRKYDTWQKTKCHPLDEAQLRFMVDAEPPVQESFWCEIARAPSPDHYHMLETCWCKVLGVLSTGHYRVRLLNDSAFDQQLRRGQEFLAGWDGCTVHAATGRPIFMPRGPAPQMRPGPKPAKSKNGAGAKAKKSAGKPKAKAKATNGKSKAKSGKAK